MATRGSARIAGCGVFGVAAALELSRRGWRVTLADPGPVPRPEAASVDISKIVRLDYGGDALYTELMEEALPLWRSDPLFHEDGFLLLSRRPLSPDGFEGKSYELLTARGHRLERLDAAQIAGRHPAWRRAAHVDGYFNPAAGWAESGRVLGRMIDDARAAGVGIETGTATVFPEPDALLVAAGAWTPSVLPELAGALWAVAQPVFHLRPDDPAAWRAPRFPVWASDIATTGWYGFPANADGLVKIAHHGPGRRVDPDAPRTTTPEEASRLGAFLRESLPELADAPIALSKTCLYCDSVDGDFWIGAVAGRKNVFVAAGDSGHGFKFAPVIGRVIADAIEGTRSRFTERFAPRAAAPRKAEDARFGLS